MHASQLALFRGITRTRKGEHLRLSASLSYTHTWELFLAKWKKLEFDTTHFGLHSLQAGGASAAANAGVLDHLFKWHSHWKPESTKDEYIKNSQKACRSVSASLKL